MNGPMAAVSVAVSVMVTGPAAGVGLPPIPWSDIVNFDDYAELLPLVRYSLLAGLVLGLTAGLLSVFVMMRDLPFAVHGISELSFAGASGALLIGADVATGSLMGSVAAAVVIGALGVRARDRNSIIGVVMPFGLGLGVLFLALYHGRSANKFGLLTGQIVAVDDPQLTFLLATCVVVVAGLLLIWRPLTFASVDPHVAAARGVPVGALSLGFMVLVALVVALSVQVVGALLVLSLICTPGAAAVRVTRSPLRAVALSAVFGAVSVLGGILLSLGSRVPISPYVTTLSFLIYLACRIVGGRRGRGTATPAPA